MAEINRIRVNDRPPMRQYILATTPGGRTYRWAEDEPSAERVLEDLEDSSTAPGGCKELSGKLARRPGVDYSDMKMGTKIKVFGAGQRKLSEYRLERAPRTSGDYLVMEPAAVGYQALLSDKEEAMEIFIGADLSGWGDPSTQRRQNLRTEGYSLAASVSSGFQDSGAAAPGVLFDFTGVTGTATFKEGNEQWYYGGGVDLGYLKFDYAGDGFASGPWLDNAGLTSNDLGSSGTDLVNMGGEAASLPQQSIAATASGRKYALIQSFYTGAFTGQMTNSHLYSNIRVLGNHGLPLYGTWPEVGLLASDVIAYLLSKYAPSLRYTTGAYGSIKPSSFVIPHLAFKDQPVTVQEMITQAIRFELLEWGVWPGQFGPTFSLNPRGQREGRKRWRSRMRPAKFEETGQQMDQVWNRVVVSYNDVDGSSRILGPPGSGFRATDPRCEDTDPLNPINETGEVRTKHIALNNPATQEGAAEIAERFLEQAKLLDGSGSATLTGFVEDEHGVGWPYYCVDAGDEIEFLDASIKGYRYIVEAKRSRSSRSVAVQIDAPPDAYAAMLERLDARETAGAFS